MEKHTEKSEIFESALEELKLKGGEWVVIHADVALCSQIIGQLQLALRHPANIGPSSETVKTFVIDLIGIIAPAGSELNQVLMQGFDEQYDC